MTMIMHKGATYIPRQQLAHYNLPPAKGIWQPIAHDYLADTVQSALEAHNFEVIGEKHAVSKGGMKYFGYFELTGISKAYSAVVGFRNSMDKSLSADIALGSRVFICDNLALMGEIECFRKHTTNILTELPQRLDAAIQKLPAVLAKQDEDFTRWQDHAIDRRETDHAIGELYRGGVLTRSLLAPVFDEFKHQSSDHGAPTLWRLFNATTYVMKSDTETGAIVNLPTRTKRLHSVINQLEEAL